MAWVRIDDSALGDLKIVRLPDSALRLWLKGLCYCQMHLTDGLIPREAIGPMEAKRKDVDALCSVLVVGKSPLWERDGDGFRVHDYLKYNDSREDVNARKDADRVRKQSARLSERTFYRTDSGRPVEVPFCSVGSESSKSPNDQNLEVTDRAARFLEKYGELYSKHRHGARLFRQRPALDWADAQQLCAQWDDARLLKLAEIFLTTDDEWIAKTDRGFRVFVSRASWCDERLASWEAKRRPA